MKRFGPGIDAEPLETIAVIPARGGSRSIPGKNIRSFAGKPLIYWTLRAANTCLSIDRVVVATEDRHIAETVEEFTFAKAQIYLRSRESATDSAPSETVLLDIARDIEFETMVFLQATNPFTSGADIQAALQHFKDGCFDSLLSVVRYRRFLWDSWRTGAVPVNYDYRQRPRRQDFEGVYLENGAFYITTRKNLLSHANRLSGRIGLHVMPEYSSVEIDEPHDWIIAEQLFQKMAAEQTGDNAKG